MKLRPVTTTLIFITLFLIVPGTGMATAAQQQPGGPFFATPPAGPGAETVGIDQLSARFAPHSALSFSPDGTVAAWSAFYDVDPDVEYDQRIFLSYLRDGRWTEPQLAPFAFEYLCGGPTFTAEGLGLVFTARYPLPGDGDQAPNRVWQVKREGEDGWGEPQLLTDALHHMTVFSQISLAADGRLYFGSREGRGRPDIWTTGRVGQVYGTPRALIGAANSPDVETDIWVDPQQRFLLFTAFGRPDGAGAGDLYLSLPEKDGGWSEGVNLGPAINTEGFERFGSVAPEGRTLTWVHADGRRFPGPNHHFNRISLPSVLNALGYRLMAECDAPMAHRVLTLAADLFPDEWNSWDSLADAHKAVGDSTAAHLAYDRVLTLNPEAPSAIWGKRLMERAMLDLADETEVARIYRPGQNTGLQGAYLGQSLPGLEPELFAPGIIATCGRLEYNPVFTPDGKELYFSTDSGLMACYLTDEGWTAPAQAPMRGFEPHITADGRHMFIGRGSEIWRLNRTGEHPDDAWDEGEKICDGMRPWTDGDGNLYVTDIAARGTTGALLVMLPWLGDGFGEPVALPDAVNLPVNAAHPCLSPDGNILLFDSFRTSEDRPKPYGDFFLSRRTASGVWGQAELLPPSINAAGADMCATFSHDGRYLFYTAKRDIYWVDARILDQTPDVIGMVMEKQEDQVLALLQTYPEMRDRRNQSFNSSLLHIAAQAGSNRVLAYLLDTGMEVDNINWDWHTALHWAAFVENMAGLVLLLEHGAQVDAATYKGETPLYVATQYGRSGSMQALIEAGADVKAMAKNQVSLMHAAAAGGHAQVVPILLENGADVDSRNLYRKTPLHYAASVGNAEVATALLVAGADLQATDSIGRNGLDFALDKGHEDVAAVLREAGLEAGGATFPELYGSYLGQTPPGRTPELFAPGIVSTEGWEFGPTFTPDGKQMLFTRREGEDQLRRNTIMITRYEDGRWTKPAVTHFSGDFFDYEPFVIDGGKRLVFGSRRPLPGATGDAAASDAVQWVLDRDGDSWTNLRPYGAPLTGRAVMYTTMADNGNLYFTSKTQDDRYDLFWCKKTDDGYAAAQLLGGQLDEPCPRMHPFIAPDESYMLFDAQPEAPENYDNYTYVCFRTEDGEWGTSRRLNLEHPAIKTHGIAMVTPDGKYMFFSSGGNLFWVGAQILQDYRH